MKKTLFIFFICIISYLTVSAQTQSEEFIEVIAEDTLSVIPEETVYILQIKSHVVYETFVDTFSRRTTPPLDTIEANLLNLKVLNFLIKFKIDTFDILEFSPLEKFEQKTIFRKYKLRFSNFDQFNMFLKEIYPSSNNYEGYILSQKHSKLSMFEEKLYLQIIANAQKKASILAAASKRNLGKILQLREMDDYEPEGGWTAYPPLSLISEKNFDNKIVIHKKLVLRFAW